MSINKPNKRKKNLSDWSLLFGLVSLGSISLALLLFHLLNASDETLFGNGSFIKFLGGILTGTFILLWVASAIFALVSLITMMLGLIFWLVKKEKPTWKLLLAPVLNFGAFLGVMYLINGML